MHIGNKSSINFYANIDQGYLEVPTLRIDNTTSNVILDGVLRPYEDNIYDLGSTSTYWKDLYLSTLKFRDGSVQYSAIDPNNLVTSITAGTGISITTSTGSVVISSLAQPGSTSTVLATISTSTLVNTVSTSTLRIVTPPENSFGHPADLPGDVAFDSNFIYYCTATFGGSIYTAPTLTDGSLVDYIIVSQDRFDIPPDPGWMFQLTTGGEVYTITNVATGVIGPLVTPYYQLTAGSASLVYSTGTAFLVTSPSATPIWVSTPWNSITQKTLDGTINVGALNVNTATISSSDSNVTRKSVSQLVDRGVNVVLDNIAARVTSSGPISLQLATVSGTIMIHGSEMGVQGGGLRTSRFNSLTLSPNPLTISNNNYSLSGDTQTLYVVNQSGQGAWRITLIVNAGFSNNSVSIERLT